MAKMDEESVAMTYNFLRCEIAERNRTIDDLRAQLAAKDEEIAGLKSRIQCMVDKAAANKLDGYRELGQRCADAESRAGVAEARVRNCHELIAEATCRISPEDHAELTEQFQNELSGCDCLTVFDEQAGRIVALEAENRELSSGIVTAETLTLSHEGHIEKLEAENARLRSNHEQ